LASKRPTGEYAWLKAIQEAVSDIKKAGLSPKSFKTILESNYEFLNRYENDFSLSIGQVQVLA